MRRFARLVSVCALRGATRHQAPTSRGLSRFANKKRRPWPSFSATLLQAAKLFCRSASYTVTATALERLRLRSPHASAAG